MHTLAFVNQKGGCGKTTTAVNLAGALSAGGRRVLLVDFDPQAHATLALGCAVDGDPTLAGVLLQGAPIQEVIHQVAGGIDLLPSSLELSEFEDVAEHVLHSEGFLAGALAELAHAYDIALIDCPPRADGVLTANALRASDTVILVVETGTFALQGAVQALRILEDRAAEMETRFELRVLGTLFDKRLRLERELLIGIQSRFGSSMFDTVIHSSVRLREAAAYGVPVQVLDPTCRAVDDFASLAGEINAAVAERESGKPLQPQARGGSETKTTEFQGARVTWMG